MKPTHHPQVAAAPRCRCEFHHATLQFHEAARARASTWECSDFSRDAGNMIIQWLVGG